MTSTGARPDSRIPDPRIIVALDFSSVSEALAVADRLDPGACRVKVGKELFVRGGPDVVRALHERGHQVFLDLKFHDIPNTVAGACRAAADLGVWMMNVHASGGRRMMEAAREAVEAGGSDAHLIAVTVLTSLDGSDLDEIGLGSDPAALVCAWARLAEQCGMAGIVCSPADLSTVAEHVGETFMRVTPGVRPAGSETGDQRRISTPAAALAGGASYLVIGRPITAAPDPQAAVLAITRSL